MSIEKDLPKTAAQARSQGSSHYFTGKQCKNGHLSIRSTKGGCLECAKKRARDRRSDPEANERINQQRKNLRKANSSSYRKEKELKKRRYNEDPKFREKIRENQIQRDYGIDLETYKLINEIQDSRCAICNRKETRSKNHGKRDLAIDHDHKTGAVRGLLCSECNQAIGQFAHSQKIIRRAVKYLRKS